MSWAAHKEQFQTPPQVADYMVSLLPAGVKTVLEPTPGIGNIVAALHQYDVTAPKDFFLLQQRKFDAVVMNPPFSAKYANMENAPDPYKAKGGMLIGYKMLAECMEMSDNVIALMPSFVLMDSDVRARLIKDYGFVSFTMLPRKTFNYARIQTCVLQLKRGHEAATEFKVFDRL